MTNEMDMGLEGKVAMVTGGGSRNEGIGNGRAAAILLARAGAKVVVVDSALEAAEVTAAKIREAGGEAFAWAADVSQAADCEAMVQHTLDKFGRLDVLDNNVGIGSRKSVVDESLEDWNHVMQVNVTSMMLASKYAIPAMMRSGGGAIVNVSSISALRPRGLTSYSTSKGAVIALTKAMAVDHGPDGVRVNCIAPGPVYTPMVSARGMDADLRKKRRLASVLGVEGSGWDIGNAVLFLSSAMARYITGQTLVVDGGATLKGPSRESRTE